MSHASFRACNASCLNPAPGNHAGTCFTGSLVIYANDVDVNMRLTDWNKVDYVVPRSRFAVLTNGLCECHELVFSGTDLVPVGHHHDRSASHSETKGHKYDSQRA